MRYNLRFFTFCLFLSFSSRPDRPCQWAWPPVRIIHPHGKSGSHMAACDIARPFHLQHCLSWQRTVCLFSMLYCKGTCCILTSRADRWHYGGQSLCYQGIFDEEPVTVCWNGCHWWEKFAWECFQSWVQATVKSASIFSSSHYRCPEFIK